MLRKLYIRIIIILFFIPAGVASDTSTSVDLGHPSADDLFREKNIELLRKYGTGCGQLCGTSYNASNYKGKCLTTCHKQFLDLRTKSQEMSPKLRYRFLTGYFTDGRVRGMGPTYESMLRYIEEWDRNRLEEQRQKQQRQKQRQKQRRKQRRKQREQA